MKEIARFGKFVVVEEALPEEETTYDVAYPSITEAHGCTGCWFDEENHGYCREDALYIQLIGDEWSHCNHNLREDVMRVAKLLYDSQQGETDETVHF